MYGGFKILKLLTSTSWAVTSTLWQHVRRQEKSWKLIGRISSIKYIVGHLPNEINVDESRGLSKHTCNVQSMLWRIALIDTTHTHDVLSDLAWRKVLAKSIWCVRITQLVEAHIKWMTYNATRDELYEKKAECDCIYICKAYNRDSKYTCLI